MQWPRLRSILFVLLCLTFALTFSQAPALASGLAVSPSNGPLGTTFTFSGSGFNPGELVALWINNPDGSVTGQGYANADSSGAVSFQVTPVTGWQYGYYVQVAHGMSSAYEVTAAFRLSAPPSAGGHGNNGSGGGGCSGGQFSASGFTAGETASTWTTRPDGVSLALPNAVADENGVISFLFQPQPGWPAGSYIVVAYGLTSKFQGVNNFFFNGTTVTGGASCSGSSSGGAAPAAPSSVLLSLKNIVNPQGNGVYLNTDPTQLYFFGCNWKWRPMGGVVYFLVVGFQPNDTVQISYQILGKQDTTYVTTVTADGRGVVSWNWDNTGRTAGHYHWWFTSPNASYCGHYDLWPS